MNVSVISLGKAAEMTGISRSTIYRMASSGRLSTVQLPDGTKAVEVAELERAMGGIPSQDSVETRKRDKPQQPHDAMGMALELGQLRGEVKALRELVEVLRAELAMAHATRQDGQEKLGQALTTIERQTLLIEDKRTPAKKRKS